MKFWLDTEFIEDGRWQPLKLISIGIVAEDGREFYAENAERPWIVYCNPWVKANVLPHLTGATKPIRRIARDIVEFVGRDPEFWGYYCDYDWVVLCQLFGSMMDLPAGWPMFCRDVKQLAWWHGVELPVQEGVEHHALADARWTKLAYETCIQQLRVLP